MLIRNGKVFSKGKFIDKDIFIEGNKISAIGTSAKDENVFEAKDYLIIPGIRNTHMHASTSLMRGAPIIPNLDTWVEECLWKFEQNITKEEVYYGALLSICNMLKSGITYFEDMHFFESEVLKACEKASIRASLCEALMDNHSWKRELASIDSSIKLARKTIGSELVEAKLGIVSIRMTSEDMINRIVDTFAANQELFKGYHLHLNEVPMDAVYSKTKYGVLPTFFFHKKGILRDSTTLAHCVNMADSELDLIKKGNSTVSHCIGSNLRLRSGMAPIKEMASRGIKISLGLDSPALNDGYDLLSDARMAGLLNDLEPKLILSMLFGNDGISEGDLADLVFINKDRLFPFRNIAAILALGTNSSAVTHVMVNGKFSVLNGSVTNVDEKEVERKALKLVKGSGLWSKGC